MYVKIEANGMSCIMNLLKIDILQIRRNRFVETEMSKHENDCLSCIFNFFENGHLADSEK